MHSDEAPQRETQDAGVKPEAGTNTFLRFTERSLKAADSRESSFSFASRPPAKPRMPPDAPTSLWQGATIAMGLRPFAAPTARAPFGEPSSSATDA